MIIGVPKEIKSDEYRVAMLPVGVEELARRGHTVLVQKEAGIGSGLTNQDYIKHGGEMIDAPEEIFERADMIVKVKEPQPKECEMIREGQIVFTYFHFASSRPLTDAILSSKCAAVAYETLSEDDGRLPLLTPMSEVAGRMSIQEGAKYLERPQMGRGILLGGVPGVAPANVAIIGGGVVGANAARMAAGLGANVTIMDVNMDRLGYLHDVMPSNVTTLFSDRHSICGQLEQADLIIGAVLVPGAKAPELIGAEDLKMMKSGSVIVDVAVDQGGCVATTRPTTHADPTFIIDNVVHYCVANMPGAVGRTSTFALCNVTLPWVLRIVSTGLIDAADKFTPIARAINVYGGKVTNRPVADTFGMAYDDQFKV